MKKHYREENNCLNCGATLQGKYCHICGQENLQIKESFGHMMNHAISDYFHFDHQFFHTLKPLFFKPGFLTNEYMAGRRAQYLHPVKMYIFISLLYFLMVFNQQGQLVKVNYNPTSLKQINELVNQVNDKAYLPEAAKQKAINEIYADGGYKKVNNQWVADTSAEAKERVRQNAHVMSPTAKDSTYAGYLVSQQKLPEGKRDGWFERFYNKKAYAVSAQHIDVKEAIKEGLQHDFPKLMFILLPLFALIVMIAFYKTKKYYVEHLIYAFHVHCFVFLFLTIIIALKYFIPDSWSDISQAIGFLAALVIIWYVYKSLRAVYHYKGWRTVTKMLGIAVVYFCVFTIFFTSLILFVTFTVA